jgi:hypothetical protein
MNCWLFLKREMCSQINYLEISPRAIQFTAVKNFFTPKFNFFLNCGHYLDLLVPDVRLVHVTVLLARDVGRVTIPLHLEAAHMPHSVYRHHVLPMKKNRVTLTPSVDYKKNRCANATFRGLSPRVAFDKKNRVAPSPLLYMTKNNGALPHFTHSHHGCCLGKRICANATFRGPSPRVAYDKKTELHSRHMLSREKYRVAQCCL